MSRYVFLALLLAGCATAQTPMPNTNGIRVDHVIVGVADLERGIDELERLTGVRSVVGGVHPGRGTRNALMSLGDGIYLEILAPDPAQSIDPAELGELRAMTNLTPVGWAVSADDERPIRSALAGAGIDTSTSVAGSRARPDGSTLRWTTFGYEKLDSPLAPFFIVWESADLHPSRTSPSGCRLTGLHIESRQAETIARAVAPLRLQVTVSPAAKERMQLSLSCPKGDVTL